MSTQLMNGGCFDSDAELFEQSGDIGSNDELFENCAALGSALHCCELVVVIFLSVLRCIKSVLFTLSNRCIVVH